MKERLKAIFITKKAQQRIGNHSYPDEYQWKCLLFSQEYRKYGIHEGNEFARAIFQDYFEIFLICIKYGRSPQSVISGYIPQGTFTKNKQMLVDCTNVYFKQVISTYQEPGFQQQFTELPEVVHYDITVPDITNGLASNTVQCFGSYIPDFTYCLKALDQKPGKTTCSCHCGDCIQACIHSLNTIFTAHKNPSFDMVFYLLQQESKCFCRLKGLITGLKNYYNDSLAKYQSKHGLMNKIIEQIQPYENSLVVKYRGELYISNSSQQEIQKKFGIQVNQATSVEFLRQKLAEKLKTHNFAIQQRITLKPTQEAILSECSLNCKCDCLRVVSCNNMPGLYLREIAKGYGLFASEDIVMNQYICTYTGEIRRGHDDAYYSLIQDALKNNYFFQIANNLSEFDVPIDAKYFGSLGRFANDAKDSNAKVVQVFYGDSTPDIFGRIGIPVLAFFASRNIAKDEEICINYEYAQEYQSIYPWLKQQDNM